MTTIREWSEQQVAIFRFFVEALGNLIVRARAGTGKTTTIVEAVKRYLDAHPGARVVVCAFNKRIADELVTRFVGYAVDVKTLHALGFAAVRRFWEKIGPERTERGMLNRADTLTQKVCGSSVPDAVKRLVSKLHTKAREINPLAQSGADLLDLAYRFECEPDEEWEASGFDVHTVCNYAYKAMELAASVKPMAIDFADMIFLPVRNHWLMKTYDLVVVDEAQDMTVAQLEIARGICRGRIVVVGDDRQAIYGFRGADSGSIDRLKAELAAEELGLTITYRCGRKIVDLAATLVPDFSAGPHNPDGQINHLPVDKLADAVELGDFVLSRMNAPLVKIAMMLLRNGKRTRIAGRDIGASLCGLVRKLSKSARSVPEFLERLTAWERREVTRALKADREAQAEEIMDRAEILRSITDGVKNLTEVTQRIEALFTDDGLGQAGIVTCSSVHRAKGLEAERVFVLAETLRDRDIEELNICYVAITRAKSVLTFVGAGAVPVTQEEPLTPIEQEFVAAQSAVRLS